MKRIISIILTFAMLVSMCVTVSAANITSTPKDIVLFDGGMSSTKSGTLTSVSTLNKGTFYATGDYPYSYTSKSAIGFTVISGTGSVSNTTRADDATGCYEVASGTEFNTTYFNFGGIIKTYGYNLSIIYDIMIPDDENVDSERKFIPNFSTDNKGTTNPSNFAVKYADKKFTVDQDAMTGINASSVEIDTASYTPGSWVQLELRACYDSTTQTLTYGAYVGDKQIFYAEGNVQYAFNSSKGNAAFHLYKFSLVNSGKTYYDNIHLRGLTADDKPTKLTLPEPDPDPTPDPEPDPTPDPEPDPTPDPEPDPTPDPEQGVNPYENATLLFDYNLNKAFAETELGKKVIIDKFDSVEKYNTEISYEDNGIKISHKGAPIFTDGETKKAGATVDAFGLNLTELISSAEGNSLYKTGYSGKYALEYTFNIVQGDGWNSNNSTGRSDLFIDDEANKFDAKNNINIRIAFKPVLAGQENNVAYTGSSTKAFALPNFENGKDLTVCFVFDTVKNEYRGYTKQADGTYKEAGTGVYDLDAVSILWYRIRSYCEDGDSITFKNIKVYEFEKNTEYSGNVAYEKFVGNLPETIVDNTDSVTENIVIPETMTKAGAIGSLNEDLVKVDGTVTRRFEDTKTGLTVSGNANGIYYEKIYGFTVKAMEGAEKVKLADYNFASEKVYGEFVSDVNGTATTYGYKLTNNKQQGEVLGMLKVSDNADAYTNTYYYDHTGAYDFEMSLTPSVKDGTAYVEVGNYTQSKGFAPFCKVKITADNVAYCGVKDDVVAVKDNTAGNKYDIKFRTYTDEKSLWVSVNSKEIAQLPYSYNADKNILNAYRVYFADGTENDSLVINDATFTRFVKTEDSVLEKTIDAADSIKINDIILNPDDAYGNISLPEISGYNINWTSNNPLVDLDNKYVYRSADDTDIVISAVISPVGKSDTKVLKEFNIKIKGTNNPEYLLEGALAKIIPEKLTNQNPDALIADIELPETTVEGYSVSWDSLSDDIISDKGVINKNINIEKDTKVTFELTVTAPSGSASKEISFTVSKRGADVECAMADLSQVADGFVTYTANVEVKDGSMYLCDNEDNKIIGFTVSGTKLIFDNGTEYTVNGDSFALKMVMNSDDRKVNVFVDDKLVIDNVSYTEKAKGFKNVVNNGLTINDEKVVFDEYSLFDYNVKVFEYFASLGEGYVNADVLLKTNSIGGVNVVWTTSDSDILTKEGVYTTQNTITFFDVTATLTTNSRSGAYYKKVIDCVAIPAENKNVMSGSTIITTAKEDINNDTSNGVDNNFSTYFEATRVNETTYVDIDMNVLKDINSVYLFRDADDTSLVSCDIYVSKDGKEWSEKPVASVNFSDLKSNNVNFDLQNARYIRLANIVTTNGKIKLYEVKGYVSYSSDDKAYKDIEALNMPTEYELNVNSLTLPSIGYVYGSQMVWKTSDPSVISLDGTVTKPNGQLNKEVVLTVTATFEGKTSVKSFIYLVSGNGSGSMGGSGGGAGGGGSAGGSSAGVHSGGSSIAALPQQNEIVQVPSTENIKTEFVDVKTSDWYYTYLMNLKNKGIVNGYEDGNFYPNNTITREEFIKMLVTVAGFELTESNGEFDDVKETDWFAPYVYTAQKLNIVNGMDDDSFGAGMAVSRQDMSVMIYKVLTMQKDIVESKDKFADDSSISEYAKTSVYSMKALEVLNGYEDGTFNPGGNLTRAEAVKVISLIINII